MSSPNAAHRRAGLHAWLERAPGRDVLACEVAEIHGLLANLFGYHLLQVGRLADADLLATSRTLHRAVVDLEDEPGAGAHDRGYPTVRGTPTALPFESHGIDVVVLPHVLEFERRPHEALRETFRVLVPEGHLLICGFNPWSLLGLWRAMPRRRAATPWSGDFLGPNRIRDWLALLGFDVVAYRGRFFRPPFRNERLLRRIDFVERAGERLLPYLSGVYVLLARKRVTTLTPLRPMWKPRRRLVEVGFAGPSSARVGDGSA